MTPQKNTFNGILNVYKEQGYTSHDVVAKLRGILKRSDTPEPWTRQQKVCCRCVLEKQRKCVNF